MCDQHVSNDLLYASNRLKVGREVAERDIVQFVPFRDFARVRNTTCTHNGTPHAHIMARSVGVT